VLVGGAGDADQVFLAGTVVAQKLVVQIPLGQLHHVEAWLADPALADRFFFQSADLADRPDTESFVKAVVERWDGIDVLVNNADVARDGILALFSDDDVDTGIDLNLKGTLHITRLVSRRMLAKGGGEIVNISSIVGLSGYRGLSVYSATKAALDAFTRSLARELGSRGITVNSVAPGYLRTEMSHGLDDDQLQQIVRRTPAGRLGKPEDVALVAAGEVCRSARLRSEYLRAFTPQASRQAGSIGRDVPLSTG